MSIWNAPTRARTHIPAHPVSLPDLAIFAGSMIVAMLVGIVASGLLPIA